MQPVKPSFLEYFEQKEKEIQANSHSNKSDRSNSSSEGWKVPPEGDFENVSNFIILSETPTLPTEVLGQDSYNTLMSISTL